MIYCFEDKAISNGIRSGKVFQVSHTTDLYLDVSFVYESGRWNGAVPLKARYQGVDISLTEDDVFAWAKQCYEKVDPAHEAVWQEAQQEYWADSAAHDTKMVFNALNAPGSPSQWHCRKCGPVPQCNPQPAARIRDLKKMGYFIATKKMDCPNCGGKQCFDILVRLPRQASGCDRRQPIPVALQKRVKQVLPMKDACFDEPIRESAAFIDHKFPSTRWVQGETANDVSMTDEEIYQKFQILTNQTNLQKERYCQRCLDTGVRGDFFGVKWFYEGDAQWRGSSPADEAGCIGCCWYDLAEWRRRFNRFLA